MPSFDWDEGKAAANLEKHGIDFEDVARGFLGLAYSALSSRDGETRITSVVQIQGRLVTVVWTPRSGVLRIISARRSSQREQRAYHQAVGGAAEDRKN